MPKGVDHYLAQERERGRALVQKSLMPKGVDHVLLSAVETKLESAKIFDAERR